ncbi:MAG: M48 family metallopeptidase, partial [Bdellovibrionales bacterium]
PDKATQEVWSKLKAAAPIDLQDNELYILESLDENAFAALGGKVFLTTRFLKNSTSLNERIFIMGHELGHQHYRHPVKSVYTSLFSAGVATLISGTDSFSGLMFKATSMAFSRQQETEADMFALDLVQKISGNAKGAFDFFKRINKKYGMLENLNGGFFATHPLSKERIEYLEKECSHKFGQESCS